VRVDGVVIEEHEAVSAFEELRVDDVAHDDDGRFELL
jgi:hypothetical protein